MRRRLLPVLAVALTVLAVGAWAPADAGPNGNGNAANRFTVVKVVEGPVPAGAVFDVEVECVPFMNGNASPESAPPAVTFQFDENGDPVGDNAVMVGFGYDCTATETEANGAQVSYSCETVEPSNGIRSAAEDVAPVVECLDDQTVRFSYPYTCTAAGEACVEEQIVIPEPYAEGIITVTNTFEEVEEEEEEAPAAAGDVVAATPPFTG